MSTVALPLRLGAATDFTRTRAFLHGAGFDEGSLRTILRIGAMDEVGRVRWGETQMNAVTPALWWSINVFLRGLAVSAEESRKICGAETFAALEALALLRAAKNNPEAVVCPVWLYPADGFLMVSDRTTDPDGGALAPAEDVVFPAIYGGTLRFLRLLPPANGGDALDLCGGSGIGALHLARTARVAVTADITERSAFFAEFNGRLNDARMESLQGDVYAPVAGRQFDVITAHPPFVPATGANMVYRDGGETGEEVTRRVIEGLSTHLRPGGWCVVVCVARDTMEKAFEQRARDWLGAAGGEFDIVFGLEKTLEVREVVDSVRKRGQQVSESDAAALLGRLRESGTRQFVYGALVLRRCAANIPGEPLRLRLSPDGGWADFERLFAWRRHCRRPGLREWLANARPRLSPQLELTVRHAVRDGELAPVEAVFSVETGLPAALRPDGLVVPLVARLNGRQSVSEVFGAAQAANELPEGFELDAFAGLVRKMIERGFLEVTLPD